MTTRTRQWLRATLRNDRGVAAVEFALMIPLFCLVAFGAIDFGSVLTTRFRLDAAVSAAANFTLVNATSVSATGGAGLAQSVAKLLAGSGDREATSGTIVVNNGPSAVFTGATVTASGTASGADSCYCPVLNGETVTWGGAMTCGSPCGAGGQAGKFVSIEARQNYSPFFASYGVVQNGAVVTRAIIKVQ